MEDTYQPPFESCVKEGHASCLMCAYNQVNGVPACARADLLEKARKEWGFKGYPLFLFLGVITLFENLKPKSMFCHNLACLDLCDLLNQMLNAIL